MNFSNSDKKTELQGVRYVQGIVEDNYSMFQSFEIKNDRGNDCYIEFVKDGIPTNYAVLAQIKSGPTHKDGKGYKIPADKAHLIYWSRPLYLSIGIVYDIETKKAFWVDISAYLKANPQVLNQKYHNIRVEATNEFSEELFTSFMNYCFVYKETFTGYEKFGRSLESFASIENPEVCYEGLKSLYLNHRDKKATWFYIISSFSKIKEIIRIHILGMLSYYVDNPHVFWTAKNIQYLPSVEMQQNIVQLMTKCFRVEEIKLVLPYMEEGINRGDFSFSVFLIINLVKDAHLLLKEISFRNEIEPDKRNLYFWVYLHLAKYRSVEETLKTAEQYLAAFPFGNEDEALLGLLESIKKGELSLLDKILNLFIIRQTVNISIYKFKHLFNNPFHNNFPFKQLWFFYKDVKYIITQRLPFSKQVITYNFV